MSGRRVGPCFCLGGRTEWTPSLALAEAPTLQAVGGRLSKKLRSRRWDLSARPQLLTAEPQFARNALKKRARSEKKDLFLVDVDTEANAAFFLFVRKC